MVIFTKPLGAGRWGSDEGEARAIVETNLDAGGNLIDTADIYSGGESEGRSDRFSGDNPYGGMLFTERKFDIVDVVREMAAEIDVSMAHIALAWLIGDTRMGSLLLGASRPAQLQANIAVLEVTLSAHQRARLDAVSALPTINPYFIFDLPREMLFGGHAISRWARK